jgi:hypothetical protein
MMATTVTHGDHPVNASVVAGSDTCADTALLEAGAAPVVAVTVGIVEDEVTAAVVPVTAKGAENSLGWVKSFWFSPTNSTHWLVASQTGCQLACSPKVEFGREKMG